MGRLHVTRVGLVAVALLAWASGAGAAPGGGQGTIDAPTELACKPDVPEGYKDRVGRWTTPLRQDITAIRLVPQGGGVFDVEFVTPANDVPALRGVDFKTFVPRIPAAVADDPTLARVTLIQRELNRNQTKYDLPDNYGQAWIANNCLKAGLWEVAVDRKDDKGYATVFHAWFDFPAGEYARLFEQVNGRPYPADEATGYPKLDGFRFPLDRLRVVVDEAPVAVTSHTDEAVGALPEQTRKAKLVATPGVKTYGDWTAAANQPITKAKFSEPGYYTMADPVRFDLTWLGSPTGATWRTVRVNNVAEPVTELEVTYANGYRLIIADQGVPSLPTRTEPPKTDPDVIRLTFGICTPDIYATKAEREAEIAKGHTGYLVLLDRDGNHLDNHTIGVDRAFLWRDAAERLHVYLVGYERIALVSHLSVPWVAAR